MFSKTKNHISIFLGVVIFCYPTAVQWLDEPTAITKEIIIGKRMEREREGDLFSCIFFYFGTIYLHVPDINFLP